MSSLLIRAGGLVAMTGGLAATTLGSLHVLRARGVTVGLTEKALQKGHYENPVAAMLLVGVLAAVATLRLLQGRHYGTQGVFVSVAAFAGVTMVLVGGLAGEVAPAMTSVAIALLLGGALAASLGLVCLGILVTVNVGVLPRWCGIALIAGSPPGVGALLMFSSPLVVARIVPGGLGWALAGIPWVLVGYAVFRAGTGQRERASRTSARGLRGREL